MLALPQMPPATLEDVLADLGALRGQLPPADGVRYFNRLYVGVTSELRGVVASGQAEDPRFLAALGVAFADAYLSAVLAADTDVHAASPAWRPLFEARLDKHVAPIQFALAGANAHINYDLPVEIVATARMLGVDLAEDSPQHRDFERIADIFARVEDRAKSWLLTGLVRRLDRLLGHVDDRVAIWSLLRAREAAWANARTLWALDGQPKLAEPFRANLAHTVGAFGRGLLLPSAPGVQRWLDLLRPV